MAVEVCDSWMDFMAGGEVLTDTNIDYSEDSFEWDGKPLPEPYEPDIYDDEVTSREKMENYHRQVHESGGFDVDAFDSPYCGIIGPMFELPDYLDDLAKAGLEWLKRNGDYSDYRFSKVLKANDSAAVHYYITFEAKNCSGVSKIFQTLVSWSFPKQDSSETIIVESCRVKPGQGENSSEEISDNDNMLETRQEERSSEEISDNNTMSETRKEENSSEEISDNDNKSETRQLKRKRQEDISDLDTMLDE